MSTGGDVQPAGRDGWFVRAAGAVGDLGHPVYRDERQRDVVNEAAAITLEVVQWLALGSATLMVWVNGAAAVPYAFAVFSLLGVANWVFLLYVWQRGVPLDALVGVLRVRLVPWLALLALFLVGVLRVAPPDGFLGGLAQGALVGSVVGVAWMGASWLHARRRARRGEA